MKDDILLIPETDSTPRIELNGTTNTYTINGISLPFNAPALYDPVLKWLNTYGEKFMKNAVLEIRLTYFNTPTTVLISKILKRIEEMVNKGNKITVRWTYLDDEDKLEIEEDFCADATIPFEFISVNSTDKTKMLTDLKNKSFNTYAGESDKQLIEKYTVILSAVIWNSLNEEKGVTADDIFTSLNEAYSKKDIEHLLDVVALTNPTFLASISLNDGKRAYRLNRAKPVFR